MIIECKRGRGLSTLDWYINSHRLARAISRCQEAGRDKNKPCFFASFCNKTKGGRKARGLSKRGPYYPGWLKHTSTWPCKKGADHHRAQTARHAVHISARCHAFLFFPTPLHKADCL